MTCWLHFVGRAHWENIPRFEREARRYGVSRRVSLRDLKRMAWGDRVILAQWQRRAVAFGEFTVERVSGLDPEVSAEVRERYGGDLVDMGGELVVRGCGSYTTGPCWSVKAEVSEIAAVAEELGQSGPLMVAGPYRQLAFDLETEPAALRSHCRWDPGHGPPFVVRCRVVLKDVPHRQGFRAFDWRAFFEAVARELSDPDGRGMVAVRGQFYASPGGAPASGGGEIQQVQDYQRARAGKTA